jgi:hypothetical protein
MRILLALWLISSSVALAATNDDYTINIHVSYSRLIMDGGHLYQQLDTVIDGHHYELGGPFVSSSVFDAALLLPGDYKAKIVKEDHRATYKMMVIYEFKFPDGKTDRFTVIGVGEEK